MKITEDIAKKLWATWHNEIAANLTYINKTLITSKSPAHFSNWLKKNGSNYNHHYTTITDKTKHYGNVLFSVLVHAEKGRMYFEKAFYPLSKGTFKRRISIDMGIELTKHFVERFILRWQTQTLQELERMILAEIIMPHLRHGVNTNLGLFDVTTQAIFITENSLMHLDILMEENVVRHITVLSNSDLSKRKQDMVEYILSTSGQTEIALACTELPRTTTEADNVLMSTKARQTEPMNYIDQEFYVGKEKNMMFKMLKNYDPTFNLTT
ncbi:hypothetical protein [Vibrio parahaemolyticus]|uniref:hypothetical protein n=1 Tax=Vibrio parahaemolyticus TaxID=670 RepID=UPI0006BEC852|nr:hypothetical protein ACX10_15795 [Vibrio parahaemolyticus]